MTQSFKQDSSELEQFLDFFEEDLENVRRVKKFCEDEELDAKFIVHAKAETVDESAENTGVEPEEIVKTLVFQAGDFVAVLCPGDTSVDEDKLEEILQNEVDMATPSQVKEATGYTIGGVSPFDLDIKILMEEELMENEKIKPAAGSRVVGARVEPEELKEAIGAELVDVGR